MPKGLPEGPPIGSKSAKRTQNDSQDPFREVLWKTRGKSVAARGPQEAQRTKTKDLKPQSDRAGSVQTHFPIFQKRLEMSSEMLAHVASWPPFSIPIRSIWLTRAVQFFGSISHMATGKIYIFYTLKFLQKGSQKGLPVCPRWDLF